MSSEVDISEQPYIPAPSRRFQTEVNVAEERTFQATDRHKLKIHVKHISDLHVGLMKEVITELPSLVKIINEEARRELWLLTRQTLGISPEQISALQAEAWDHERWHARVVQKLPCLTVNEAQERCKQSPWDVSDLLVLPHGGRRYVPLFQFLGDGTPSPAWATLMSVLLEASHFDQWDLLTWLMRPDALLDNQPPMLAINSDIKRVLRVAQQIEREATL